MKFIKKPITVEAIRWDGTAEGKAAVREFVHADKPLGMDGNVIAVLTNHGLADCNPGDWIICSPRANTTRAPTRSCRRRTTPCQSRRKPSSSTTDSPRRKLHAICAEPAHRTQPKTTDELVPIEEAIGSTRRFAQIGCRKRPRPR
jgi:hypothetical protein